MDVSVIIVNYNTQGLTSDCIESIIAQTSAVEYEIILVDNASTDGSKEVFAQDKRIKYIYSDQNLGFGRANNLGIREAKGRYLFFLNSDTDVYKRQTDNTRAICQDFINRHSLANWLLLGNEENQGFIVNFQNGFKQASGDLILIADQDDICLLYTSCSSIRSIIRSTDLKI